MKNFSFLFFTILFLIFYDFSFSQKSNNYKLVKSFNERYQNTKSSNFNYDKIIFDKLTLDYSLQEYLSETYCKIDKNIQFKLGSKRESKTAWHYQFQFFYDEIPIFNNYVKLNIAKNGTLISEISNLDNLYRIGSLDKQLLSKTEIKMLLQKKEIEAKVIDKIEPTLFFNTNAKYEYATRANVQINNTHQHLQIFLMMKQ